MLFFPEIRDSNEVILEYVFEISLIILPRYLALTCIVPVTVLNSSTQNEMGQKKDPQLLNYLEVVIRSMSKR